ncbi:MAG: tRNA preQ1(34) S-adenosylmethionine ribosyltransferase-isomerase QueA [Thermodesulfobacteriota bacterium]|nr:tRNA preQ1(34) S-adenosylmethionine ribosyltransferase-isomerase QueA [Thermodesulfobacteriota bacterium]
MYLLSDYRYDLPGERIAQEPVAKRDESRLLRVERKSGVLSHHSFQDIKDFLRDDDLVVINNTKVIPARFKGTKETGGKVEVLIIDYSAGLRNLKNKGYFQCDCLVKASKAPKQGMFLFLGDDLKARVEGSNHGILNLRFFFTGDFREIIKRTGEIPLPPYIKRDGQINNSDKDNYQTVFAAEEGAVAAPTAGLHFTGSLMEDLVQKGVEFVKITLHVGYGTFVPVRVDDIREHEIHSEFFSLSQSAAERINRAKSEGRRVVAVGTTTVRTLEYVSDDQGRVAPDSGMCNLFIYPGYRFKCIDAMITNFHLPESTLLMLVSAFAGKDNIFAAYEEAVKEKYRFFSYGDAMFLE